MKKIDLINSEGCLLSVGKIKEDPFFILTDEDGKNIVHLSKKAFGLFLNGEIIVQDTKNRLWNYSTLDKNMKQDPTLLAKYILDVL